MFRLVLTGQAPELQPFYPCLGGREPPAGVWPVLRPVIGRHVEELREALIVAPQTNEVGRSPALLGGLLHLHHEIGLPVRLLEVGASGGLNLLFDRYAHDVAEGVVLGDPASPVVLRRPWQGPLPPAAALEVVDRLGQFGQLGATRAYVQLLDLADLDHVELVAADVLPQLR